MSHIRRSRRPTDDDPTDVFGRKVREPAAPQELALETPPPRRTSLVALRHEDKVVFDAMQAWLTFRLGRRVSQWDAMSLVLAAALANREAEFGAFDAG